MKLFDVRTKSMLSLATSDQVRRFLLEEFTKNRVNQISRRPIVSNKSEAKGRAQSVIKEKRAKTDWSTINRTVKAEISSTNLVERRKRIQLFSFQREDKENSSSTFLALIFIRFVSLSGLFVLLVCLCHRFDRNVSIFIDLFVSMRWRYLHLNC